MEFGKNTEGLPLPFEDLLTHVAEPAVGSRFFTTEAPIWGHLVCRIVINFTLSYETRLKTN